MLLSLSVAAATFFAAAFVALWLTQRPRPTVDVRVRALVARPGVSGHAPPTFQQRVVVPLIGAMGRRLAALLPGAFIRRTERRLTLAASRLDAPALYALAVASGLACAASYAALVLVASSGAPAAVALLPAPLFGAVGLALPGAWIVARARSRRAALLRNMPDSFDLLTICVEAGLGLDGAFRQVAEHQQGPFVDEIRRMLGELALGKSRREALRDLADRVDLDDARAFVNAVVQAEEQGTSLARVLRVQAQRMRMLRRQRAEQDARRVPVKMVFPLVFCLMPSLFIFILGPVIVGIVEFVSS